MPASLDAIRAATGTRPGESGTYIDRTSVIPSAAKSYDREREEVLWNALEGMVAT